MSLHSFLDSIGLDEKSQKVYFALLKSEDAPAATIAKKAGLPRTTTYHHLESMVSLGLATKYRQSGVTRFAAENPNKIKGLLEGKLAQFEKYLPDLQKVSAAERLINLRLFEGNEGVQQIVEEELGSQEKVVRSIGTHKDLRSAANGKITFTSRRVEKKIFSKCLRPMSDEFKEGWIESQQEELREVRILPADIIVPGMTFIYDDKVAVITPEEEGLGFIINSKTFSESLKNMFDALWEKSSRAEK